MAPSPPNPFICYAREDRRTATRLRRDLARLGAEPWLDEVELLGGEEWDSAIRRALRKASHVIVLLSRHSVTKRGYYQREIRIALDLLEEVAPGEIFILPVRIDDCEPRHDGLKRLHYIDLFKGYPKGLRRIANRIGLQEVVGPPKVDDLLLKVAELTSVVVSPEASDLRTNDPLPATPFTIRFLPTREQVYTHLTELIRGADLNSHVRAVTPVFDQPQNHDEFFLSYLTAVAAKCHQADKEGGSFTHHAVFGFRRVDGDVPPQVRSAIHWRVRFFVRHRAIRHVELMELTDEWPLNMLFINREHGFLGFPAGGLDSPIQYGLLISGTATISPLVDWYDNFIEARSVRLRTDKMWRIRWNPRRTA